jgi:hypothetical protein
VSAESAPIRVTHARIGTASAVRAQPVTVRTPVPRELWQSMHDADPVAMPTQAPLWLDCLTATGKYRDASRLYEMSDGRLAILPLVRSRLAGPVATLHSLPPNWGWGGLVAPQGVDEALIAAVMDDLSETSALRAHVSPNALHGSMWAAAAVGRKNVTALPCSAHVLDLEGGFERVWHDRFKSATRTAVRRAEKAGVLVETDTTGKLVPVFFDLLLQSIDRWAAQHHEPPWLSRIRHRRQDPIAKFHTIAERMGEQCEVSVAWHQGEPAAATIVLRGGANAHYSRGAMNESLAGPVKANCLLHKLAIESACRDGCRYYYMGGSGTSKGLAQFKSRFGAHAYDYAEYWIERIPVYRADAALRNGVKRIIGFRDTAD